jgi:hypothetical protein
MSVFEVVVGKGKISNVSCLSAPCLHSGSIGPKHSGRAKFSSLMLFTAP